jgi:hypothetical protein
MVDMKLPDGSTQKVSSVVADAVNREFNNPNGSDAEGAYGAALGQLKQIDPSAAHTGDIVQWENHSAVIVRESQDNAYMIIDGEPKPLNLLQQGDHSDYRFFHPSGADPSGGRQGQGNATTQAVAAVTSSNPSRTGDVSTIQA